MLLCCGARHFAHLESSHTVSFGADHRASTFTVSDDSRWKWIHRQAQQLGITTAHFWQSYNEATSGISTGAVFTLTLCSEFRQKCLSSNNNTYEVEVRRHVSCHPSSHHIVLLDRQASIHTMRSATAIDVQCEADSTCNGLAALDNSKQGTRA